MENTSTLSYFPNFCSNCGRELSIRLSSRVSILPHFFSGSKIHCPKCEASYEFDMPEAFRIAKESVSNDTPR